MKRFLSAVVVVVALLVPASPGSAAAERQTFVLYQGPGQDRFTVYAAGPISGVGVDILLGEGIDPSTGRTQRRTETVFPQGSTFNTLTVIENSLAFDPVTCVARVNGRSHLDITGGTEAFEGVSGSGEVVFRAISIARRTSDGCSRTEVSNYLVAHITGTATIPA